VEAKTPHSWPEAPKRILEKWPNGFPPKDSPEFNKLVYGSSILIRKYISRFLERELSTIDCLEIRKITRDVFIEYFSGSFSLGPYEEVSSRYYINVFGYVPEEAREIIDGTYEETREKTRTLFHRLHAQIHHE